MKTPLIKPASGDQFVFYENWVARDLGWVRKIRRRLEEAHHQRDEASPSDEVQAERENETPI